MESAKHERVDTDVDQVLDGYLGELARIGTADLDVWAAKLARGDVRERFRREALAAEYNWRLSGGEVPALEAFAARLPRDEDRQAFLSSVQASHIAQAALPPQYSPGALLGDRYRIRSVLGRGGMSVVFSAGDQELERDVAIKVFNALAHAGSAGEWEQIAHSEAAALARLDHPNVVRVHDIRRDRAHTYIVMDRVRGIDLARALDELSRQEAKAGANPASRSQRLRELLATTRPDEEREDARAIVDRIDSKSWPRTVARILAPVAAGVDHAHRLGHVHRDLKPNNVLLRAGADPVVLDFGLSARVRPGADDSAILRGTPEYFAPEQARDLKTGSDVASDVYQLGLLAYEMLALERAQSREKGEDIFRFLARVSLGVHHRLASLPAGVPRSLRAICARALEPKPGDRYASAGEMACDLERFVAGLPNQHARTGRAHGALQRTVWTLRRPAFAALVLGMLALGVGAWMRAEAAGIWVPPSIAMSAYSRSETGASTVAIAKDADTLSIAPDAKENLLGIEVEARSPSWVYTLGVTGNAARERGVYPLRPRLFGQPESDDPPWAVKVDVDALARVMAYPIDGKDPEEGLLVLALEEPSPAVESWLAQLDGSVRSSGAAVPYAQAMREFEEVAKINVRGLAQRAPGSIEAEVELLKNMKVADSGQATEGLSRDGRIKWFQQILRVRRKE